METTSTGRVEHGMAPLARVFCNLFVRDFDDMLGREAEFCEQPLEWCGGAKGVHSDDRTAASDIAFPTDDGTA
jgi:hypothetical protein